MSDRDPSGVDGSNDAGASTSGPDAGNPIADGGASEPPSPQDDSGLRKALLDKGLACNVVNDTTPGTFNLGKIQDDYDRCAVACIVNASCIEVANLYCEGQEDALTVCIDRCPMSPTDGFKCANGTKIPHAFVCDLIAGDCPGGDDEGKHCGTYSCNDGQVLMAEDVHCDASPDCDDESDEWGCSFACGGGRPSSDPPSRFTCKNGRPISADYVCDGEDDCDDGGDEKGCPPNFTCDFGGTSLHPSFVCDGEDNCFDGTDEKNCP